MITTHWLNIKLVKNHYAETNNELSEEINKEDVKIRLYATEDNKMWFEIDNSLNLNEAETTHTETAKQDMEETIKPFFNDLRDNKHLLPSEVNKAILKTQEQIHEIANGLNALLKMNSPIKEQPIEQDNTIIDYIG